MSKKLRRVLLRSMLSVYCYAVLEAKKNRHEYWYDPTYRLYKKLKGLKKIGVSTQDSRVLKQLLTEVEGLEDKHFTDNKWNAYSLVIMTLEHLVLELDDIDLKPTYLNMNTAQTRTMLEVDLKYSDLQKRTNRYFRAVLDLLGDK